MRRTKLALVALMTGLFIGQPLLAQAGCGCSKLPPELAEVRPNATYAGMDVTLTHPNVQSGQSYDVTFTSGMTGASATVTTIAVTQRDLADSQEKPQVVASVPALPLGPASISVSLSGQSGVVMAATDEAFTVAPQPLVFSEAVGVAAVPDYQAAVSRNGTVYLSLDVTDMHLPRTFQAQTLGYPLRFTNDEVVFYNTQGFMMQLLDEGMPGLFAIDAATGSADSDTLQYSRHEFNTHFLQHEERQSHEVDASDPNWHADGTPHITHDYLIVAISGMLDDGSSPEPGATPAFELALSTFSFFHHGVVGTTLVNISNSAVIDSYQDGVYGGEGDILSNGDVVLNNTTLVYGDATAPSFDIASNAVVTGALVPVTEPAVFLPVDIPTALEDLGSIVISTNQTLTLSPGSYQAADLSIGSKGHLKIENAAGPVTLYLTGAMNIDSRANITIIDTDPEKFAIYIAGNSPVTLANRAAFHGVVYAPESVLHISGRGQFFGAFVGDTVILEDSASVHYNPILRGEYGSSENAQGEGEGEQ